MAKGQQFFFSKCIYRAKIISCYHINKAMSNSAYIVGADWCGFTKKQLSAIPDDLVNTEFKYVNCAAEPENPLCEGVQGFPTMKTHDGETQRWVNLAASGKSAV